MAGGTRRAGSHKVGVIASSGAVAALLFAPFGTVRAFRLAAGTSVSLFGALPALLALVPLALWLAAGALSLGGVSRTRGAALARGLSASAAVVSLLALSNVAARRVLPGSGDFARYSLGAGVWLSIFFAVTLVIASRRETGAGTWRAALVVATAPLGVLALVLSGRLSSLGMAAEYRNVAEEFWLWGGQHLLYASVAMGVAIVVGVGLGIVAFLNPGLAQPVFAATSVVQTIPSLAMIGVLAVPLGFAGQVPLLRSLGIGVLGWAPVVVALTLYALLVIVRNTYAGLSAVPEPTVDAGRGMGMTDRQLLGKVELPLASPIVFSGMRTAFQQTIGNATLAYFVAAGSLGRPIFSGVSQQADDLVLLGSVALVTLALTIDVVLRGAERLVTPRRTEGSVR